VAPPGGQQGMPLPPKNIAQSFVPEVQIVTEEMDFLPQNIYYFAPPLPQLYYLPQLLTYNFIG